MRKLSLACVFIRQVVFLYFVCYCRDYKWNKTLCASYMTHLNNEERVIEKKQKRQRLQEC